MKIIEGEIVGIGSTLATIHKTGETKKAFIVEFRQGNQVIRSQFLPKSQVKYENGIFEIPDWLAKKVFIRDYVDVIKECAEKRPEWLDDILKTIDKITSV